MKKPVVRSMQIALAAAAIATLGGGVTATAAPSADTQIPYEISAPSGDIAAFADGTIDCSTLDGGSHPFLILDEAADNTSRWFRRATYHLGDGEQLRPGEFVIPGGAPSLQVAHVHVQIEDNGYGAPGHETLTVYCASTLKAAHQA